MTARGFDPRTGRAVDGREHLALGVADVLWTPIGTRVMRRDYGSRLPELIDQAMTPLGRQRLFAATAVALARWKRDVLRLTRVTLTRGEDDGAFVLELEAVDLTAPAGPKPFRFALPFSGRGPLQLSA